MKTWQSLLDLERFEHPREAHGETPVWIQVRDAEEKSAVESYGTAREPTSESDAATTFSAGSGVISGVKASVDLTDKLDAGCDCARDRSAVRDEMILCRRYRGLGHDRHTKIRGD